MAIDGRQCEIKASLLSNLSSTSLVHAQQAALLSAQAAASNHEGFSQAMKLCGETQSLYETAKNAFEAHRRDHGC